MSRLFEITFLTSCPHKSPHEKGPPLKGKNCFPITAEPFSEGSKILLTELAALKSIISLIQHKFQTNMYIFSRFQVDRAEPAENFIPNGGLKDFKVGFADLKESHGPPPIPPEARRSTVEK